MSQGLIEVAQHMLETAQARVALVEQQRRHDGGFLSGIRLAHAKAMVQAAERHLRRAQETERLKA